ncbi:hypothetical protein L218DRAFT_863369 [Marasmius fiardii PR-910]|nr:hypothetical protein L218DRAFT_863369 [Marasmius fiardii PR-910]
MSVSGNIIILPSGEGRLIDWELAKKTRLQNVGTGIVKDGTTPRQYERTGTWQFMSARPLSSSGSLHELADDLESFFWILSCFEIRENMDWHSTS